MFALSFIILMLAAALMGSGNAAFPNATSIPTNMTATNVTIPIDVADPVQIICQIPGYDSANAKTIGAGIDYLQSLHGNATLGHADGGGWCWRYSCSYGNGIYGCNDGKQDVQVPWMDLGDYAYKVLQQCSFRAILGWSTQGQAFHPDGWNVVVGLKNGDNC